MLKLKEHVEVEGVNYVSSKVVVMKENDSGGSKSIISSL